MGSSLKLTFGNIEGGVLYKWGLPELGPSL